MGRHVSCVVPLLFLLFACDSDEFAARDASTTDSGLMDATVDAHNEPTVTWTATKTTLDVWWSVRAENPGFSPFRNPGRDKIEVFTLTSTAGACDAPSSPSTVKICGITLPTWTSDVTCDAYQLTIPDSVWEGPLMPDDDGLLRVIASVRLDGTYTGPYDDGFCSSGAGTPYVFRGLPTSLDLVSGGGLGAAIRADALQLRLPANFAGNECDQDTPANSDRLDLRAPACTVDPATLPPEGILGSNPRLASMDYACTAEEALFLDSKLPQYRVLAPGDRPGETDRPLGWTHNGYDRDIDRSVSEGTRTVTVTLDDDTDGGGEPTCAQVRAAVFP